MAARASKGRSTDRLAEIEARAAAATPGPWRYARDHERSCRGRIRRVYVMGGPGGNDLVCWLYRLPHWTEDPRAEQAMHDAAFIASAREDVLHLLAEVRRLQGEVGRS